MIKETLPRREDGTLLGGQGMARQVFTRPREVPAARTKPMDRPEGAPLRLFLGSCSPPSRSISDPRSEALMRVVPPPGQLAPIMAVLDPKGLCLIPLTPYPVTLGTGTGQNKDGAEDGQKCRPATCLSPLGQHLAGCTH